MECERDTGILMITHRDGMAKGKLMTWSIWEVPLFQKNNEVQVLVLHIIYCKYIVCIYIYLYVLYNDGFRAIGFTCFVYK